MIWALCLRGDNQTSFVLAVSSTTSWFVRDSVALTAVVRVWLFLIKSPCKPVAPSFCSTFYNSKESRGSPACCHAEQESCERQGRQWSVRNIDVKPAATPLHSSERLHVRWMALPAYRLPWWQPAGWQQLVPGHGSKSKSCIVNNWPKIQDYSCRWERWRGYRRGLWDWRSQFEEADITEWRIILQGIYS